MNAQNLPYKVGINKFSDLTDKEFEANYLGKLLPGLTSAGTPAPQYQLTAPDAFDWREKKVIGPVKDQGSCGSCWAFGANSPIEAIYSISKGSQNTYDFSEQQLVDCSRSYGNQGCNGGWPSWAMNYIKANGLMLTSDYKYTARDGTCKADKTKFMVTLSGYIEVAKGNEVQMKEALYNNGPLAIAIYASRTGFRYYTSGVYYDTGCPRGSLNHAVTAVGYGTDRASGLDFWAVRNSWGVAWGDKGYILMARNKDSNCGVADVVIYPNHVRDF
jgi:cathepsin L